MNIALDGTVVRPPLTGVHYAVRHEVGALLPRFAPDRLRCLATDRALLDQAAEAGVACPPLTPALRHPWRRIWWQQVELPRLLRASGCDALAALAYTAPRRCPVPYLLQVHDTIALRRPELCSRLNALHMRTLMPGSIRAAGTVIVAAGSVRQEIIDLTGKAARQVQVVPLGVDPLFCRGDDPPLPPAVACHQPYLLYVGTVEPKKGVDVLMRAHDRLAGKYPDLRLVIAGRIGWKSEAVAEAIRRHAGGRIVHLGYVDRLLLPHLYRGAAACVVPSREEGFGLPILEAMAMGTPVVHSDHPVLRETAGGCGIAFPIDDDAALAQCLADLLGSADCRAELIDRGRAFARRRTWPGWAAQVAVLLDALA